MGNLAHIHPMLTSLLCCLLGVSSISGNWCGYQSEWKAPYTTITYETKGFDSDGLSFNATTGVFTSPQLYEYMVTVTAVVGGMLPPKPGDLLMTTSPVYAQLFLKITENSHFDESHRRRGVSEENAYLLVKEGEVAALKVTMLLNKNDRVHLVAGHVTKSKYSREAYNHKVTNLTGGFLEDVTFCIVKKDF